MNNLRDNAALPFFDDLGKPAQRPGQNVLTSHGFDAYGSNFISLSPPNDPYGYYGAQYGYYTDLETGLQLLTNRYYDASNGRFLTRDPIGYSGGQNLYEYTSGNPVGGVDPSGLDGYWANVWRTLKAEGRGAFGSVAGIPGSIYRGIKRTFTPGDPAFLTPGFFVGFAEEGIENARGFWSTVGKAWDGDIDAGGELVGGGLAALLMGKLPGASRMSCPEFLEASPPSGIFEIVKGYTRHGLNQAISREGNGVSPSAILDTIRDPLEVRARNGTTSYIGRLAKVVVNRDGKIVTVIARTSKGWRGH